MILFHISLKENRRSIAKQGVSPAFSRTRFSRCWYCDNARVIWALAHISLRYKVPVNDLIICVVSAPTDELQRTRWQGVYTLTHPVRVSQFQHPKRYLQDFQDRWGRM